MCGVEMDKTNHPLVGCSWKNLRRRRSIYSPVKRLSQAPGAAALAFRRNVFKPKYPQIMTYVCPENLHLAVNTTLFSTYILNNTLFKLQFFLTVGVSEDDIEM